ncbi:MAG: TPM domain-containing protein [Pseudomonadota bacterium]
MNLQRIITHLLTPDWFAQGVFRPADLTAIESAVSASEKIHRGELRFVFEGPLPMIALWRDLPVRHRATQLFAQLGVWDTEENSGILIYVQLIDRRVEILADRGIAQRVPQAQWDALCRGLEAAFRQKNYRGGALEAITKASELLVQHFPAGIKNPNELPNRPVRL